MESHERANEMSRLSTKTQPLMKEEEFDVMKTAPDEAEDEEVLQQNELARVDDIIHIRSGNSEQPTDDQNSIIHVGRHNAILSKPTREFLKFLEEKPKEGTHGYIISPDCKPVDGKYAEDIHFKKIRQLHKSGVRRVTACKDSTTNTHFIRKEIKNEYWRKNEGILPVQLAHDNIVKVLGIIQRPCGNEVWMELLLGYAGIPLSEFLKRKFPLPKEEFWGIIIQGLEALKFLHLHGITHHDVKPDNLAIQYGHVTLIDFGSSRSRSDKMSITGWTPEYMAPECCQYYLASREKRDVGQLINQIETKVDVFSFGMVIGFLITGKHLLIGLVSDTFEYPNSPDKQTLRKQIVEKTAANSEQCLEMVLGHIQCEKTTMDLIEAMTCVKVEQRLSAKEALTTVNVLRRSQEPCPTRKRALRSTSGAADMLEEWNTASISKMKKKGPSADFSKLTAAVNIHGNTEVDMRQTETIQLQSEEEENEVGSSAYNNMNIDIKVRELPRFDLLLSSDNTKYT